MRGFMPGCGLFSQRMTHLTAACAARFNQTAETLFHDKSQACGGT